MEDAKEQSVDVDFKVNLSEPPKGEEEKVEEPSTESKEEVVDEEVKEEVKEEVQEAQAQEPQPEKKEDLSREDIFNQLLSDKYNIKSEELEEALSSKGNKELPEEVEKYLEYRNETNRGMEDYLALQKDYDNVDDTQLLKDYYRHTKNGLDESDIDSLLDVKFGYNEGADETLIKTKKLEMKEELYKAKQFFEEQKGKYRKPLESSKESLPENTKEAVEFFQLYKEQQKQQSERSDSVRKTFEEKTNALFNEDFKGFEYNLGEEKVVFKPKDVKEVKSKQSDLNNFLNKHLDDKGALVDAEKYHKAMSMAMNPEAYAKFFYEQGKASAIDNVVSEGKNIDMNVRSKVSSDKVGNKFRVVEDSSPFSSGLKINKR